MAPVGLRLAAQATSLYRDEFVLSGHSEATDPRKVAIIRTATLASSEHLGLSLIRLDINPGGIMSPNTHYLDIEILFVLEGERYSRGLLHFQLKKGAVLASSLNILNNQNPGGDRKLSSAYLIECAPNAILFMFLTIA
ncbi:protein MpCupin17 [Marchantia polymorpha subsp. ruderalis]|uniref:Cupin type-1 domain-containing protein n=1 Tax=Marchantia polymorpha TaxID=3197 RepID=A0A2R6WLZ0_MARPO|nr:hypothetical protein MARPO_0075s0001 [Marchantia polymorpha]BBN00822.1 hypothetical protein Mp_2g02420 [Marchantia polymorpha subsp. ruderalis]|eukprot:PTQ34871.1 hypothetical protein MARPO_0075s0001 [Marchantia polymorpha]